MDDFPICIKELDKCLELLYKYEAYYEIAICAQQLFESKILMQLTLEAYTELMQRNEIKVEKDTKSQR